MHRHVKTIITCAAVALFGVLPLLALSNGELDGDRHPAVGECLLTWTADGSENMYPWCTGVLIAPDVLLTAGHCVVWAQEWMQTQEIEHTWVTFNRNANEGWLAGEYVEIVEMYAHPEFAPPGVAGVYGEASGATFLTDIGVMILAHPVTDVPYAQLPPLGFLDDLQGQDALKGQIFTQVGYGWHPWDGDRPWTVFYDGNRRVGPAEFQALTPGLLILRGNEAQELSAACALDSGSPEFLGDTNTVVGLTSLGDSACRSLIGGIRLDREGARTFIDGILQQRR